MTRGEWRRMEGGYMRRDGEWFLERGPRMSGGGASAWLIHRRVDGDRVGEDEAHHAYDTTNGNPLWKVDERGYLVTAHIGVKAVYAHQYDAGSLAEAKYTVTVVEREEPQ